MKMPLNACLACSYGIKAIPYIMAEKYGVPLIVYAGSQEEKSTPMLKRFAQAASQRNLKRRLINQMYRLNPNYWRVRWYQAQLRREFHVSGNSIFSGRARPLLKNRNIRELHLFDYIAWDREKIKATIIKELEWKRTPGHISSWRNDCALHSVMNYLHIKKLDCTRDCFGFCRMIKFGKMGRDEALMEEEAMLASFDDGVINGVNIATLLMNRVGLNKTELSRVLPGMNHDTLCPRDQGHSDP
jgi:hypothetical protein